MSVHRLLPLFDRARVSGEPLVLATVIRTAGSTYAKPGAQMLIASDGEYAGLLSGGCLEGDLREHARAVAASGSAAIVRYDLRSTTDQLFGLGAGCEGAMDILLTRAAADGNWQPLADMAASFHAGRELRLCFVVATDTREFALGQVLPPELAGAAPAGVTLFTTIVAPAARILLLGGGPDARPVAELCAFLGWRVTVADHRASYLLPERFPDLTRLVETRADELATRLSLADYAAAVVMSHHLQSDLHYLRALSRSAIPYVGLLGPAGRREKLLGDLGEEAAALLPRLRAPVGLDIGGRAPESIALSIVGEVHAVLAGRAGRPFTETAQ